jgi:hypothetical protein
MPAKKKPGPSVKDSEIYEEIRAEGGSKEKAPRIANSAAAPADPRSERKVASPARTTTGRSTTYESGPRT